jgi:hypothetical protein
MQHRMLSGSGTADAWTVRSADAWAVRGMDPPGRGCMVRFRRWSL